MSTEFIFRGFQIRGSGQIAAQVSLDHGMIYTIPLTLKPGEEPTEEWIRKELEKGIREANSYREAFQPFLDKYQDRIIELEI